MALATLGLAGMAACVKWLGRGLPVWELLVWRAVIALLALAPAIYRAGPRVLATARPGAHLLRSAFGLGGIVTMFYALVHLDLALVTTLGFTRVLFMIVLAVAFLGEVVRWRRTAATLVGFAGVLICVQPGSATFDPWTLVALASALFAAGVTTMIKRLTRTESPLTILVYAYLVMGGAAVVPAALDWRTPSLVELAVIGVMGLCSAFGQSCMVHALRAGEASAVAPIEYTRLLWAALLGYLLFGDVPAASTWLGGAVIVGSTLYISVREARLRPAPVPR